MAERFFVLDKFNTWYDWHCILTEKTITPPTVKTNFVELQGVSGSIDLTESLTGETPYSNQTISASFWTDEGSFTDRATLLRKIRIALHGKKIKIIDPDDPDHYFYGRVKVLSPVNNLAYATFKIEADCDPWRYALEENTRYTAITESNPMTIVINNYGLKTVIPDITITGTINITVNGLVVTLTRGTYKLTDLKLRPGVNLLDVSGNGSISLTYREAEL